MEMGRALANVLSQDEFSQAYHKLIANVQWCDGDGALEAIRCAPILGECGSVIRT